jgi:hypothetical protein
MKRIFIFVAFVAATLSASAQMMDFTAKSETKATRSSNVVVSPTVVTDSMTTFNASSETDEMLEENYEYVLASYSRKFYADKAYVGIGSDPDELMIQYKRNNGLFLGVQLGISEFDRKVEPTLGFTGGYQGRYYQVDLTCWFQNGYYTPESDRAGQKFLSLNSYISVKGKILDVANHHIQLWAGPRIGYKFSKDYHEMGMGTSVTETDDEIITTKNTAITDLKASTFGYDFLQLQLVMKPRWSRVYFVGNVSYGRQSEFYADGNRWHDNWLGSVEIRYNLQGKKEVNTRLQERLGLEKSDMRSIRRAR